MAAHLPFDILDTLVEKVREAWDYDTLKALSTTSRALTAPCQRSIFHSINVPNSEAAQRRPYVFATKGCPKKLHRLFLGAPHLRSYVRVLTYSYQEDDTADEDIPAILHLLADNVHTFDFVRSGRHLRLDRPTFDNPLLAAISAVIRGSKTRVLSMSSVVMDASSISASLASLNIASVVFVEDGRTPFPRLEKLAVAWSNHVRNLKQIRGIVDHAPSLRILHLDVMIDPIYNINVKHDPIITPIFVKNDSIEVLELSLSRMVSLPQTKVYERICVHFEEIGTIFDEHNVVKTIRLSFLWNNYDPLLIQALGTLDHAITRARFPKLESVELNVSILYNDPQRVLSQKSLQDDFCASLPLVSHADGVTVKCVPPDMALLDFNHVRYD